MGKILTENATEDWQIRLVNEYTELVERKEKLSMALATANFEDKVGTVQFNLMKAQYNFMVGYANALEARLVDLFLYSITSEA